MQDQSPQFITLRDLDIFSIPTFAERMEQIRSRISPKLELLGGKVAETITNETKRPLFAHVAKHARQTVNPPDETWVALSPSSRGYKMHVHIAIGVGYYGSFVKLVAKAESKEKTLMTRSITELGSNRPIWLIKGDNPVEVSINEVKEATEKKSYGLETGTVLDGVPGQTFSAWFDWTVKEIAAIWHLYEYLREKV